jgi:hypothetical protein
VNRQLTDRERQILDMLLSADFPGVEELRAQARSVTARREGLIIDLVVEPGIPKAKVLARVPVQAVVDGDGYDGGLLLYVDYGSLSGLEYWWVTEHAPAVMPPLAAIGSPIA